MAQSTFSIPNPDDLIGQTFTHLSNDALADLCRATDLPPDNLRGLWMIFTLVHIAKSCAVPVEKLQAGDECRIDLFIAEYESSLTRMFRYEKLASDNKEALRKFGREVVLPFLAEWISFELKEIVVQRLEQVAAT